MGGWVWGGVGGWCGTQDPPPLPGGAELLKGALCVRLHTENGVTPNLLHPPTSLTRTAHTADTPKYSSYLAIISRNVLSSHLFLENALLLALRAHCTDCAPSILVSLLYISVEHKISCPIHDSNKPKSDRETHSVDHFKYVSHPFVHPCETPINKAASCHSSGTLIPVEDPSAGQ